MIRIEVQSTRGVIRAQEPLTVGLRGAKARFVFAEPWEGLVKTAVFRQGQKTVAVTDIAEEVTIPWEVLTQPGVPVLIGVYGIDASGQIAIPTVWAETEPVRPGTDPEGDPSTEPTPGLWEQMQENMGSLQQLRTHAKFSLVDAINEANRPVCLITVVQQEDGTYAADYDAAAIQTMLETGIPFVCYWYDKDIVACLSGFQKYGPFTFVAVENATEYRIVISDAGVACTVTVLVAKAPVTAVNGKTGDVTVPTPVKVTVEKMADGSYQTDPPYEELEEFRDAGHLLYCQYGDLELPLVAVVDRLYYFSGVHDGHIHTLKVSPGSLEVTCVPLSSGGSDGAVLCIPQELTDDQKAQARQNIGAVPAPDSAVVGQTIAVKEVDESGKPVLWEAVDFSAAGGDWEKIFECTAEERVYMFTMPVKGSEYKILRLRAYLKAWDVAGEKVYSDMYYLEGAWLRNWDGAGVKAIPYGREGEYSKFEALLFNIGDDQYIPLIFTPNGNSLQNGGIITYNSCGDFLISDDLCLFAWPSGSYEFMPGSSVELWGVRK